MNTSRCVRSVLIAVVAALAVVAGASASDHTNTDDNFPITVEDAYPVEYRAIELQLGRAYEDRAEGADTFVIRPEITWGAFENTHLWIEGEILTNRNGDHNTAAVGALYNFNAESPTMPALAVSLKLETAFKGSFDTTLRGILTRSFGRDRFSLNIDYTDVGDPEPGMRPSLYLAGLGWDRSLGIDTLLLADIVTRRSQESGEENETLVEVGLRYQWTPDRIVAGGLGFGLSGGPHSRDFTASLGMQLSL